MVIVVNTSGRLSMIKIDKVDVYGFEAAIRGMRNPMNSWDKSDTVFGLYGVVPDRCKTCDSTLDCVIEDYNDCCVGENDLRLMKNLSKAGSDHGKYLRMINVTLDITAPLYWWKEFDTYKVGTVANSCSTMHKIHAKEFEMDDFSWEHLDGESIDCLESTIDRMNHHRLKFIGNKNKYHWWQMIQLLPSSYNQKRTVQLNYQVLKTMYYARKNHKLDEWREFCNWCETLPYFKEICLNE